MANEHKERLTLTLSNPSLVNREAIRPKTMGHVFTTSPRRSFRKVSDTAQQQGAIEQNPLEQGVSQPFSRDASKTEEKAVHHQKRREAYIGARTTARFHAVQALYHYDIANVDPLKIVEFFKDSIFGEPLDGEMLISPDEKHFKLLVIGTVTNLQKIDQLLQDRLMKSWSLSRLDRVIRGLLRVACYELIFMGKTEPRIIINEFVTVATTFFDGEPIGLINGILDGLAREHDILNTVTPVLVSEKESGNTEEESPSVHQVEQDAMKAVA
jgi:transcription antitermination protein NusB